MAFPVASSYSAASGGTIYVGTQFAPFVPSPGQLKSIHLNSLISVNPCPTNNCWYSEAAKQNGPWSNWCGGVFSPDFSQLGAMIYWGGGHNGYDGTEYYAFDLTTQNWIRLNDPVPTDFLSSVDPTWSDVLIGSDYVTPASHTYSHPVYIPPSVGGGPKGSFCLPYQVYDVLNGYRPHAFDLSSKAWTRLTDAPANPYYPYGPYGACFLDTKRNVIWGMAGNSTQPAVKIDLNQNPRTIVQVNNLYAPEAYFVPCYVKSQDMMFATVVNTGSKAITLAGYDLASGTPVGFTVNFSNTLTTLIGVGGCGIDFCPDTGKLYCYEGFGSNLVYVATPPATGSWKTGAWTWTTETMSGETPAYVVEVYPSSQGSHPYTKWKYNPAVKCFMWSQGTVVRQSPDGVNRAGAFQLYRPLGS